MDRRLLLAVALALGGCAKHVRHNPDGNCWDPDTRVLPRTIDLAAPCGGVLCFADSRTEHVLFATPTPDTPDLNGDSYADLAFTIFLNPVGGISLLVFYGRPDLFSTSRDSPTIDLAHTVPDVEFLVPTYNAWVAGLSDFDGDRHLDLAVSDSDSDSVNIFLGPFADDFLAPGPVQIDLATRTAAVRVSIPYLNQTNRVLFGPDFDADGRADLFVRDVASVDGAAAAGIIIYGRDLAASTPLELIPTGGDYDVVFRRDPATPGFTALTACDLDGDGSADLVNSQSGPPIATVHLGRDLTGAPLERETVLGSATSDLTITGINDDYGAYCFAESTPLRTHVAIWWDANDDGSPDFLDYAPEAVTAHLSDGTVDIRAIPFFAGLLGDPAHGQTFHLSTDVDGDGALDLLLEADYGRGETGIAFGPFADDPLDLTTQGFDIEVVGHAVGQQMTDLVPIGDLDGDGRSEMALNNYCTVNLDFCIIAGGAAPPR